MKTEREIIHQIKKYKYKAHRQNSGFYNTANNGPGGVGNPLNFCSWMGNARILEWVLGREVKVKKINWYQAGLKVWRGKQK